MHTANNSPHPHLPTIINPHRLLPQIDTPPPSLPSPSSLRSAAAPTLLPARRLPPMPPLPSPLRSPLTGSEEQRRGEEWRRLTGTARRAPRELRLELRQRWRTARRELRQRPRTVRREVRQRRPLLLLRRGVAAPAPPPNPARGPLPLLPRIRRAAPDPPSPAGGRTITVRCGGEAGSGHLLIRCSTLTVEGRWLQRRRRQRLTVVAVCWWRRRAAAGREQWRGYGWRWGSGRANFFIYCSFILPCVGNYAMCHEHFTGRSMPCARCRVLHTAKLLPCAIWALPCAPDTRQTTRFQ